MAGHEHREHEWWAWWRANGQEHITRLLREEWNPIGDVPADEYAGYATRIGDLLREGVSEERLGTFLADVRTGAMGLPADLEADQRVARMTHEWYLDTRPDFAD
jgi:hypothetical protein